MTSTSKEELNKSVGHEIRIPCIKCSGRTTHEVVVSVDQSGTESRYDLDWYHVYQIIRCKGCKILSYRETAHTSEDYIQISEDEYEWQGSEKLFPSRIEGRKDLGDDAIYLPTDLRRIYKETVDALTNDSPVLAGIGLRAIVETVCKEKSASGNDLYKKINDLASKHVLTPSGANILHKVRSLGNKAAHEVKPHTPTQLSLAMNVVEHMLRDVYIFPKLVEEEFGE
ncbi:DUF4145 domain-containing protein [Acinetobacter sp. VNK23]|uniref:DUF4145 domain-containing protein n=1 Tax=Acinetobacter thutiue TaxID=2998078 RepID=UPI002579233B|nr:DUF4145 domain-containing protein [Acinetobacter thutiue]MDM1020825.1 DUF4145 domain-containing protein [Acinetobacter thutiue]